MKIPPRIYLQWFVFAVLLVVGISLIKHFYFDGSEDIQSMQPVEIISTTLPHFIEKNTTQTTEYSLNMATTGVKGIDSAMQNFGMEYVKKFETDNASTRFTKQELIDMFPDGRKWSTTVMGDFSQSGDYLSYHFVGYDYTGGAHGNTWNKAFTFPLDGFPLVEITDIIKDTDTAYKIIIAGASDALIQSYEGTDSANEVKDAIGSIQLDKTLLTNWTVESKGIRFWFDQCTLFPCIYGNVSFVIPWSDLEKTIDPSIYQNITSINQN